MRRFCFPSIIALIFCFAFFFSCKTQKLSLADAKTFVVCDSLYYDSAMFENIAVYKKSLDSSMNVLIGYSEKLMKNGKPESVLGNFICDLTMETFVALYGNFLRPDSNCMVLFNNGGFRSSLPQGEILLKNIYELMPFENEVVILKMKGSSLNKILSDVALEGGMPISGAKLVLRAESLVSAKIGGKAISSENEYYLITSDYIANGGENFNGIDEKIALIPTGRKLRDVIIDYIKSSLQNKQAVDSQLDARISYE